MEKLEMTDQTVTTSVIYDKDLVYPIEIRSTEVDGTVYLTLEEAIELYNFLLDVLHIRKDQKYLDKAKEILQHDND